MDVPLRLGPLAPEQRNRIAEILGATGVFTADEIEVALEVFDSAVGRQSSDYEVVGAFAADELIGYAAYGPTPGTDRTYDLYWIATDPATHGRGAGSALMLEVERRLADANARLLVVETSSRSDYAPTRGFYGRRGYTEAARVREFYAPGDDRIILTKRFHRSRVGQGA